MVMGFPGGSNGKESARNTGDLGSIPMDVSQFFEPFPHSGSSGLLPVWGYFK